MHSCSGVSTKKFLQLAKVESLSLQRTLEYLGFIREEYSEAAITECTLGSQSYFWMAAYNNNALPQTNSLKNIVSAAHIETLLLRNTNTSPCC